MKERDAVVEIERRPEPEELELHWRYKRLLIGGTNGAHTPGAVARADEIIRLHFNALALDLDPAFPRAVLGKARHIHQRARALATREARLFQRRRTPPVSDVSLQPMLVFGNTNTQHLQRLHHIDGYGTDMCVHPFHVEVARCR